MCHSPSYTLTLFNARGRPLEKLGMSCGGLSALNLLEFLLPSILRAVLAGQPFSLHLIVLHHSQQLMLLQV
jgi:hypothetical protein